MKQASIHKDKKGYIFSAMSTTVAGFLVSDEVQIRIYKNAHAQAVVVALMKALDGSRQNIPTPIFNSASPDLGALKNLLLALDLKSFKDLNKKPTLYCSVTLSAGVITITPSEIDKDLKRGFVAKPTDAISIAQNAGATEIFAAIERAFEPCD